MRHRPDAFPHGLAHFSSQTDWPIVGHNRYWDQSTPYAKANGGPWEFIVERGNKTAIPVDAGFWRWLMKTSKASIAQWNRTCITFNHC